MGIGRVRTVELKELWEHDAKTGTSWLSQSIDLLSETLQIPLKFIKHETKNEDGRVSTVVLAEDGNHHSVIIEAQPEKSDLFHLGKIVAFAANSEAKTIVWLTRRARTEHLQAVQWLNEHTGKRFFMVQVGAIRIGDSEPAPQFTMATKGSSGKIGNKDVTSKIEKPALITPTEAKPTLKAVKASPTDQTPTSPHAPQENHSPARNPFRNSKPTAAPSSLRSASHHGGLFARHKPIADTAIVPTPKEGFDRIFFGKARWITLRLDKAKISQLKYIAGYQLSPVDSVTHIVEIKEILPSSQDPEKFRVLLKGTVKEIKHIPLGQGNPLSGPTYCAYEFLIQAKTVNDGLAAFEAASTKESKNSGAA